MTFAPPRLLELRHFFQAMYPWLTDAALGIVGGPTHQATGTSYHLGRDQLKLSRDPYSARTRRDKAGLSNAASAFDLDDGLGGGPAELQALSKWLVEQCRAGEPDTFDIREIIYSPDGKVVLTWDRERGRSSYPMPRGNLSHLGHTHISFYRDSEFRDKVALFRRFYEKKAVEDFGMFFLKVINDPAVYVSDGLHMRFMPGGQWELTVQPMLAAGKAMMIEYPNEQAMRDAGGPESKDSEPVTDEQLERVLRKVLRSIPA